jgi:hypothetical protein
VWYDGLVGLDLDNFCVLAWFILTDGSIRRAVTARDSFKETESSRGIIMVELPCLGPFGGNEVESFSHTLLPPLVETAIFYWRLRRLPVDVPPRLLVWVAYLRGVRHHNAVAFQNTFVWVDSLIVLFESLDV